MAINPANILCGFRTVIATLAATTLITIPAGRTWQGYIGAALCCANDATTAAQADAVAAFNVGGVGVVPAGGTGGDVLVVKAFAGANTASGTVGSQSANTMVVPFSMSAPSGNTTILQVTYTIAGAIGRIDAWASGMLQ